MKFPTTPDGRATRMRRLARQSAPALLLITVLLGSSACASGQSGTTVTLPGFVTKAGSSGSTSAVTTGPINAADTGSADPTAPPAEPASTETSDAAVKVCSLLTATEIKAVIGKNSGPQGDGVECAWENEQNYYSVTLHIGGAGTAINGKLPDPIPGARSEAGPDGIRFGSLSEADFLIGDRACSIQVVTLSEDSDRASMVKLIGFVRNRLKS